MPALTNPQLTQLRADGHKTKWYLKVCVPETIYTARVNNVNAARGDADIPFDTASGSGVEEGMTLWVGSAAGLHDIGITRLRRNIAANTFFVAENDDILWADNQYLTVKNEFLPFPKYPRLVAPTSYYKDYDYGMVDQTIKYPSVAMMGAPAVGILSGGVATVYFDGSDSYTIAPSATITSYGWVFPSGTGTVNVATPGNVTWSTAGVYWCKLQIEDSNTQDSITRRPILITDLSDCITDFVCESMSGDIDNGWQATFRVREAASLDEFPHGAPVFFFAVDYYGATQTSIGMTGNRDNVIMFGYLLKDTVRKDPETGDTLFEVGTVNQLLSNVGTPFPKYITDDATPANWTEGLSLNVRRALFYCIYFHSTLMEVADVFIENDATPLGNADFPDAPLWEQVKTFAASTRVMKCGVTKQGQVYIQRDVNTLPLADRAAVATVAALNHGDWDGEINLAEREFPFLSQIDLSGIRYTGVPPVSDSTLFPIFSLSPGNAPLAFGNRQEIRGLALNSQSEANQLAGDILAKENNRYESLTFPFNGNWVGSVEPALQEYFTLSLAAGDTNREIVWTAQKLIPRQVTIEFDWQAGYMRPVATFEIDTGGGVVGQDGDYPTTVPETPPVTPPVIVPPPAGGYADTWRAHVLYAAADGRVYETFTFSPVGGIMPSWSDVSAGLTTVGGANTNRVMIGDPWAPETYQYIIHETGFGTNSKLFRRDSGGNWVEKTNADTLSGGGAFAQINTVFGDINTEGWIGVFYSHDINQLKFAYSLDRGDTWAGGVSVNVALNNTVKPTIETIGAFQGNSATAAGNIIYAPIRGSGPPSLSLKRSDNKGTTWAATTADIDWYSSGLHVDPNNQDILIVGGYTNAGVNGIYRSTDKGENFSNVSPAASEGNIFWLYGINIRYQEQNGGATEWVAFGFSAPNRKKLYRTVDGGATYTSEAGSGLPSPPGGTLFGVSTVQDSPGKFYCIASDDLNVGDASIFASDDYGATWEAKNLAAEISPLLGGCVGLLQVWTEGGL